MLEVCHKRLMKNENENWPLDIMERIENFLSFVTTETKYHDKCYLRSAVDRELQSDNNLADKQKI